MKLTFIIIGVFYYSIVNCFTLYDYNYKHCYTSNSSVYSTFSNTHGLIPNDVGPSFINKCYRYIGDDYFNRSVNFINSIPELISEQCFFFELYKFTYKLQSIFDIKKCRLCFIDIKIVDDFVEYVIKTSEDCGTFRNHLIFVKRNQGTAINHMLVSLYPSYQSKIPINPNWITISLPSFPDARHYDIILPLEEVKKIQFNFISIIIGVLFLLIGIFLLCSIFYILNRK